MRGFACNNRIRYVAVLSLVIVVFIVAGCGSRRVHRSPLPAEKHLAHMGYTIQAGAFSRAENAVRLTDLLRHRGLDATYFVTRTGLYKVRFGNYLQKSAALERAETLKSAGIIDEFYIISPDEYAIAKRHTHGSQYVREELVKTARSFVDAPYLWGGSATDKGFDCSGLTMTVYQLNGFDLPRTSQKQYEEGTPVERDRLLNGDLVFFAIAGGDKVGHVGIYVGEDQFIHAPGRGKPIRLDYLSGSYFRTRYLGGRSYL